MQRWLSTCCCPFYGGESAVCCCSHGLCGFTVRFLFCFAVLCVFSSVTIISLGERAFIFIIFVVSECYVTVFVHSLFLALQWLGLYFVIVAFPGQTHLLFGIFKTFILCFSLTWAMRAVQAQSRHCWCAGSSEHSLCIFSLSTKMH